MKNPCSSRHEPREGALSPCRKATKPLLSVLMLTFSLAVIPSHAAAPPATTVFHTSTGPINGGVAISSDGAIYFSTLSCGPNNARVTALTATGALKWTPFEPGTDMHAIPK